MAKAVRKVVVLIKSKKLVGGTTREILVQGSVEREREAIPCAPAVKPQVEHAAVRFTSNAMSEVPAHLCRLFKGKRHRNTGYA